MFGKIIILELCLIVTLVFAQHKNQIDLGNLQTGATVSFVRTAEGEWGIEISNGTTLYISQMKPAQIEIFRGEEKVQQYTAGYQSVQKTADTIIAKTKIYCGRKAAFDVEDKWNIVGDVLSLSRKVNVTGTEDAAGFLTAIRLLTKPTVKFLHSHLAVVKI